MINYEKKLFPKPQVINQSPQRETRLLRREKSGAVPALYLFG